MLLGAARHLCRTRAFRGRVAFVFQPAEEGGAGALAMIEDGLMERFGIEAVYGMHNLPGLPVGQIALRPGPIMAATDEFEIAIRGKASHAALPHEGADPILAGSALSRRCSRFPRATSTPWTRSSFRSRASIPVSPATSSRTKRRSRAPCAR